MMRSFIALAAVFALATPIAAAAADKPTSDLALPDGNAKEPVSIEADKLVYFEKDQKAIYSGNVVVIQGDTKLTCSTMTIRMEKTAVAGTPVVAGGERPVPSSESSHVSHMDCAGPVTVLSKTRSASGDSAVYDKPQNKIWLVGHVTLSDRGNVTKGDKLTYDLRSGQATVDTGGTSNRVRGLFLPGSGDDATTDKPKAPN